MQPQSPGFVLRHEVTHDEDVAQAINLGKNLIIANMIRIWGPCRELVMLGITGKTQILQIIVDITLF